MTANVIGLDDIIGTLRKLEDMSRYERAMQSLVSKIDAEIKSRMMLSTSPSDPGQAPGIDTGTLVRSMRYWVDKNGNEVIGTLYSGVLYAYYLENGTINMEARPVWYDSAEYVIDRFAEQLFVTAIGL